MTRDPARNTAAKSSWNPHERISYFRDAAGPPFLHPAFTVRQSHERTAHILAQLLRQALHCLRAGFHKVGRLLMKPRPREAPRTSSSRGYSYDCCKQRRGIINVRKCGYFLSSVLSSLFSPGILIGAKLDNGRHFARGTAAAPPANRESDSRLRTLQNQEKKDNHHQIHHIYFSQTMIL